MRFCRPFLNGDGRMGVPFILRAINRGDAANHQFAQLAGKGGMPADCIEQADPAHGDGRRMQEHTVQMPNPFAGSLDGRGGFLVVWVVDIGIG